MSRSPIQHSQVILLVSVSTVGKPKFGAQRQWLRLDFVALYTIGISWSPLETQKYDVRLCTVPLDMYPLSLTVASLFRTEAQMVGLALDGCGRL